MVVQEEQQQQQERWQLALLILGFYRELALEL